MRISGGRIINLKQAMLILIFILAFIGVAYASWSNASKLTSNSLYDGYPHIAIENNNLHLVYTANNSQYYYKKKLSGSSSWTSPIKLTTDAKDIGSSAIAAYNGKAHVVYEAGDYGHVDIAYKTNKSGSWSSPVRITNDKVNDYNPKLAQENGKLYLVFERETTNGFEIFFSKNTNGTWTTPKRLTFNTVEDFGPYIAAKGGKVYVAWTSFTSNGASVKYKVLSNGTWSTTKNAINASSTYGYVVCSISIYNSVPYIAYEALASSYVNSGIAYISSGKWVKKNIVSNGNYVYDIEPKIANYGGKLRITWYRFDNNKSVDIADVFYASLDSLSGSWSKSNLTKTTSKNESNPEIVIDSKGKSHLVWMGDNEGDYEIYHKKEL